MNGYQFTIALIEKLTALLQTPGALSILATAAVFLHVPQPWYMKKNDDISKPDPH